MRKLVSCKLPHEDAAGVKELVDCRSIDGGDMICIDLRMPGGADSGSLIDILETKRYAMQRAAIRAFADLRFRTTGLSDSFAASNGQKSVDDRIDRRDARQQSFNQLNRRQLACFNQARRCCNGVR